MGARLAALLFAWLAIAVSPPAAAQVEFGRYHALVIGINDYRKMPKLKTAVNDASAVHDLLRREYGFESTLLLNPTRYDLVHALDRYRAELTPDDNLLIYYAGHGVLERETDQAFWLPVDAEPDSQANWVPIFTVTATLRAMSAKHVLVVADSCYSGALTRSAPAALPEGADRRREIARMAEKRARKALVSGGLEPVFDGGGDGHSVFARAFLEALKENDEILGGHSLYLQIRQPIVANAEQTPEYADIRRSGDEGGDFLFVPLDRAPRPAESAAAPGFDERAAELAFWNAAESTRAAAAYEAYLERYPRGMFAELARIRLMETKPPPARQKMAAAPPKPPAPKPATPAPQATPALLAPPRPETPATASDGTWRGSRPACLRARSGHEVNVALELEVTGGKVTGRLSATAGSATAARDLGWMSTYEELSGALDGAGEFRARSDLFSAPVAVRFGTDAAEAPAKIGRCEIALSRAR